MTEAEWDDAGDTISLFAIGTLLLRRRWLIVALALLGATLTLAFVWSRPALYRASASFIPQAADNTRSSLSGIAGQLGVSLPVNLAQTLSPEFYARLLKSRELLGVVGRDTLTVPELGGGRIAVADLLMVDSGTAKEREEGAVQVLSKRINAPVPKATSVVDFDVATEWPSVSLAIARALIVGVNDFNKRTRRDQASAERQFVEGRVAVVSAELRSAEDRLQQFLQTNRQSQSPELRFAQDRLERDVSLRQQVFTSLKQSYEEVRMREVRDTPVISLVDQPSVPSKAESRGRGVRTLLGLVGGAGIGALLAIVQGLMTRRRAQGDAAADEFVSEVGEMKGQVMRRMRRLSGRASA
jgi:uncharacterized protein involved in exopolysaccharide biosynthesis